jgi:hypothetical protein
MTRKSTTSRLSGSRPITFVGYSKIFQNIESLRFLLIAFRSAARILLNKASPCIPLRSIPA